MSRLHSNLSTPPVLTRSFLLEYFHDVDVSGIRTKHYEVPVSVFSLNNTNNLCYCHNVSIIKYYLWPGTSTSTNLSS